MTKTKLQEGWLPSLANPNYLFVVTQPGVALGLLMLAKDTTPDYGGRERPSSQSRHQPVLPRCPFIIIIIIIIIILILLLLL